MRKPNYNFERAERDRAKQAKADAKAQKKRAEAAEAAAAAGGELDRPTDTEAPAGPADGTGRD